jgi:hypothetical protein
MSSNQNKVLINGAYVPNRIFDRQEHQKDKLKTAFRNKPVSETKIESTTVNKPVAKKIKNNIGQQYLSDCGISTHWAYRCAPWKEFSICVENESDGAWVPFIILYREDYYECLYIKEGIGRQFSKDHGLDYK